MNLQSPAAVAAVVDLAVIVSACAAGFLLARGTRLPGWTAAIAMLLTIRAISMASAHVWAPTNPGAFPIVDTIVGILAATCLATEVLVARRRRRASSTGTLEVLPSPVPAAEAHADAA